MIDERIDQALERLSFGDHVHLNPPVSSPSLAVTGPMQATTVRLIGSMLPSSSLTRLFTVEELVNVVASTLRLPSINALRAASADSGTISVR